MRTTIFTVVAVAISTTGSSLASEAFVSQIPNPKLLASDAKAAVAQVVDGIKIASPLQLAASTGTGQLRPIPGVNYSSVVQYGTNNLAAIAQSGGSNLSAVVQHGSGNQALVSQRR
jgi:hypothetical protein